MMWYDGRGNLFDLTPHVHRRKISSLSGTVRVLESLTLHVSPLKELAIAREMIISPDDFSLLTDDVFYNGSLNDSQQEAVATASNPSFTRGIFCVLGN